MTSSWDEGLAKGVYTKGNDVVDKKPVEVFSAISARPPCALRQDLLSQRARRTAAENAERNERGVTNEHGF
jgi:hypothetical protein